MVVAVSGAYVELALDVSFRDDLARVGCGENIGRIVVMSGPSLGH